MDNVPSEVGQFFSESFYPVEKLSVQECCSVLVDNLRPSVTAEFRVIASNRYGSGKPSLPSGWTSSHFFK